MELVVVAVLVLLVVVAAAVVAAVARAVLLTLALISACGVSPRVITRLKQWEIEEGVKRAAEGVGRGGQGGVGQLYGAPYGAGGWGRTAAAAAGGRGGEREGGLAE